MDIKIWILVAVFLSVSGLTLGAGLWWTHSHALGQRLQEITSKGSGQPAALDQGAEWHARIAKIATPLARLSAPKEGWAASSLRVRFMHAGLRGPGWPIAFFTSKTVLGLSLPALYLLAAGARSPSPSQNVTILILLCLAAVGYFGPNLALAMVTNTRQLELREALPDAIDLLTVCVEAGLALDAALQRAGEEMHLRSKALAEELGLMTIELRIGATRAAALQNLALRTGVDDIEIFVSTLLQSEHFGTNVADSLRVLAETMRDHRRLRAEETAAKIPLKLLFPLIFFIFPSLMLVLLGPAVMSVLRTLPNVGGV